MTTSSALGSPTVRSASKDTVDNLWTAGLVMPCCTNATLANTRGFKRNCRRLLKCYFSRDAKPRVSKDKAVIKQNM